MKSTSMHHTRVVIDEVREVGVASSRTFGGSEHYVFSSQASLLCSLFMTNNLIYSLLPIAAFCRFASERWPLRALAAANPGTLFINERRPNVSSIGNPSAEGIPSLSSRRVTNPLMFDEGVRKTTFIGRKFRQ